MAEQEDRRRERWNRMNAGRWQKKKEGKSRAARTGREKQLWGEPEIKEDLETGRTAFCFFSWVTVWRATADPPWAHFTAQASINYQTSTLDIDRRLGCCTAGANATASGDESAATGPYRSFWKRFTQNMDPIDRMVLWLIGKIHTDSPDVSMPSTMTESLVIQSTTHNVKVLMETELP